MPELQVIARYTISDGRRDEVLALLTGLAEATRTEPGNLSFVVCRQLDDDREIVLLERYASPEAFAAHRESTYFKSVVLDQIVPCLDRRVVETFDAPDGS